MGSEMCIRDSDGVAVAQVDDGQGNEAAPGGHAGLEDGQVAHAQVCLLYTSDAADERSSVDLGGRRIIKKKNRRNTDVRAGNT